VRPHDVRARRLQQPPQDQREQDGVVELPGDRDEVGHEVHRAGEVEQQRAERKPRAR
jgi:hypothetical protein